MKRLLTAFLALCLILGMLPVTALALEDTEPNDSIPTAQEFEICDTINGSIGVKEDVDWYKFTLDASGKITLKITSYMTAYSIWLLDADGNSLWNKWSMKSDSSLGMRTDTYNIHLAEGIYHILVSGEYSTGNAWNGYATGDYTIKTDYANANATEIEDNDKIAQANELPLIGSVNGQIAINDITDFYQIELPVSGKLILDMTAYMSYHSISLYNEDGNEIWAKKNVPWDSSAGIQHGTYSMHLLDGIYYIKVTGEYNRGNAFNEYSYGNYTLKTDFVNANANEVEPNNSLATAQWIVPNKTIQGQIALNDTYDFFQFTLTREMNLKVAMTSYMTYYSLWIYDENGTEIWKQYAKVWDEASKSRHDVYTVHLTPGTYYLLVSAERTVDYHVKYYYGNYTFKLNTENPFSDVPADSFYYDPVLWAVEQGITSGTTGTTFSPNDACMRAHVVTFLWRAAGSPAPKSAVNPFTDVKTSDFFYKPVLWAVENGITTGTSATTFSPTGVCNRAQVVTFLHRAFESPAAATDGLPFTDVPAGAWYEAPIAWAVENGITNGLTATEFGPNAACNRAQVVTFLYRAYND